MICKQAGIETGQMDSKQVCVAMQWRIQEMVCAAVVRAIICKQAGEQARMH
jgi:hypothetical protein